MTLNNRVNDSSIYDSLQSRETMLSPQRTPNPQSELNSIEAKKTKFCLSDEQLDIIFDCIWEFFGTLLLAFGCLNCDGNPFGIAISIGTAVTFGIRQSGAHYNAAVSLNFLLEKSMKFWNFIFFFASQIFGAFCAGIVQITIIAPQCQIYSYLVKNIDGQGPNNLELNNIQLLLSEFIGTFYLITNVNIICKQQSKLTEDFFQTALIFSMVVFTARQYSTSSGSGMNPSIALGLDLAAAFTQLEWKNIKYIWIYIVGPFSGVLLAKLFNKIIFIPFLMRKRVKVEKLLLVDEEEEKKF